MKEDNNNTPKNKWSRILRKKWFYPALYLAIATILLTVVVWYQSVDNQVPEALDDLETADDYNPVLDDQDAEAVLEHQEVIQMPVKEEIQAEIVTKFYDYNAEEEDQENGLVLYNNRYYQSTGIDIASEAGDPFDVLASLSGTVTEVKEDPLLGHVVILTHDNDVMTYYASLGEVEVKAGATVKQGDLIGVAGKNIFGKDNGTHVHFELRKADQTINPESYFNQPVSKLDDLGQAADDEPEAEAENEEEEAGNEKEEIEEIEADEVPEGS